MLLTCPSLSMALYRATCPREHQRSSSLPQRSAQDGLFPALLPLFGLLNISITAAAGSRIQLWCILCEQIPSSQRGYSGKAGMMQVHSWSPSFSGQPQGDALVLTPSVLTGLSFCTRHGWVRTCSSPYTQICSFLERRCHSVMTFC